MSFEPSSVTTVNDLHDALLTDIFELDYNGDIFPPTRDWRPEQEKSTTRAILMVCRRWHQLCEPFLYRRVELNLSGGKTNPAWLNFTVSEGSEALYKDPVATLHKVFANLYRLPHLRALTREISIYPGETISEDVWQMIQLLRWWSPQLQSVGFHGSSVHDKECRPLFFHLAKLPLRHLSLSYISLSFMLKYFQYTGLRHLKLDRSTWTADRDQMSIGHRPVVGNQLYSWHDEVHLPPDRCSTSAIETITIYMPEHHPDALNSLFRWPAALQTIHITSLMHSTYRKHWAPEAIQSFLALQENSVRSITIGIMSTPALFPYDNVNTASIPRLYSFTQLEHLTLNEFNIFAVNALAAVERLVAPRLRCLTIDFSSEDQHGTPFTAVDVAKSEWLLNFAKISNGNGSNLQRIHLDFRPEEPDGGDPNHPAYEWPWRKLQVMAEEMNEFKVQLTWAAPVLDEKAWYKHLEERMEHNEAWFESIIQEL